MSRFRPYTSLRGQRAAFNTFQAWLVRCRRWHHGSSTIASFIGITSLLTVPALLSTGVPSESAALARVVSGIGVKGTGAVPVIGMLIKRWL